MPPGAWAATLWLLVCLARDSSTALTTFGKTNPVNPVPAKPARPPGKECVLEMDCAGIQDTSCVRSPDDSKMRCLCGNNMSPLNGKCDSKIKGLRHACGATSDCQEGMVCAKPNSTKPRSNINQCLCNTQDGFVDREFYCSGGVFINALYPMILLFTAAVSWIRIFI